MPDEPKQWYLSGQGEAVLGPYTRSEIQAMRRQGRVSDDALCCREGMEKWTPLGELEDFKRAPILRAKLAPQICYACSCGNPITVGTRLAGYQVKCKVCGHISTVPGTPISEQTGAAVPVVPSSPGQPGPATQGPIHRAGTKAGLVVMLMLVFILVIGAMLERSKKAKLAREGSPAPTAATTAPPPTSVALPTDQSEAATPLTPTENEQLFVIKTPVLHPPDSNKNPPAGPSVKVGFINRQGEVVVQPQYAAAGNFREGLIWVEAGQKAVRKGLFEAPVRADYPGLPSPGARSPPGAEVDVQAPQVGYMNAAGRWAIEPQFLAATDFSEGLALVAVALGVWPRDPARAKAVHDGHQWPKQWCFIDTNGNKLAWSVADLLELDEKPDIFKPRFSEGLTGRLTRQYARAHPSLASAGHLDFYARFINPVGAPVFQAPLGHFGGLVGEFHEGLARLAYGTNFGTASRPSLQTLWGYIDKQGQWACTPRFAQARDFHEGLAAVRLTNQFERTGSWMTRQTWVFIDTSGRVVIDPARWNTDTLEVRLADVTDFTEGVAAVKWERVEHGGKRQTHLPVNWVFIDKSGAILPNTEGGPILNFSEGLAPRREFESSGYWHYIDKTGQRMFPAVFREAQAFDGGWAAVVSSDGKAQYIDRRGKVAWHQDLGATEINPSGYQEAGRRWTVQVFGAGWSSALSDRVRLEIFAVPAGLDPQTQVRPEDGAVDFDPIGKKLIMRRSVDQQGVCHFYNLTPPLIIRASSPNNKPFARYITYTDRTLFIHLQPVNGPGAPLPLAPPIGVPLR